MKLSEPNNFNTTIVRMIPKELHEIETIERQFVTRMKIYTPLFIIMVALLKFNTPSIWWYNVVLYLLIGVTVFELNYAWKPSFIRRVRLDSTMEVIEHIDFIPNEMAPKISKRIEEEMTKVKNSKDK